MKWSREKPTVPGVYWWRRAGTRGTDFVAVQLIDGRLEFYLLADDERIKFSDDDLWAGPIPEPEEGE